MTNPQVTEFKEQPSEALSEVLHRHFVKIVCVVLLFRLFVAWAFPITADEAYFLQWGKYLANSYYDHPFMTGLWVKAGLYLGEHIFFTRLIGISSQALLLILIYKTLLTYTNPIIARLISLGFLLSPPLLLFFVFSTDTPLFFFATLSYVAAYLALTTGRWHYFVLTGAWLGLGLTSKFLVLFPALGVGLSILFFSSRKKLGANIAWLVLGFLPFAALVFYFAQQTCWWPLQFNLFNRSQEKAFSLGNFISFLAQQFFLITPWIMVMIFKSKNELKNNMINSKLPFLFIFAVSLLFLGALSFWANGLHWGLSLYPAMYLGLNFLTTQQLTRSIFYSALLGGLILIGLLGLTWSAPYIYKNGRYYGDVVMGIHGKQVHTHLQAISKNLDSPVLGTLGYTTAALMEYHSNQHYLVFKDIDTNGRNDDLWTDYRNTDQKDFVLISTYKFRPEEIAEYKNYFEDVAYQDIKVEGATFFLAIGKKFKFHAYKEGYLKNALQKFYQFKPFLPSGKCSIKDRYM